MTVTEQSSTTEWAMIGALGDGVNSGEIPAYHHLSTSPDLLPIAPAFDLRTLDSGLKTQNYDKGMDRFIRKLNTDKECSGWAFICRASPTRSWPPALPFTCFFFWKRRMARFWSSVRVVVARGNRRRLTLLRYRSLSVGHSAKRIGLRGRQPLRTLLGLPIGA
jgi:hypothetical protein